MAALCLVICVLVTAVTVVSVDSSSAHHNQRQQASAAASGNDASSVVQPPRMTRPLGGVGSNTNANNHNDFMTWSTQVLGIRTSLIIQDFDYPNFQKMRMRDEEYEYDEDLCDDDHVTVLQEDEEVISVRGLAASHDIEEGDVVISIPFHALITVPTTIDHDPVLSGLLGPTERTRFGWDDVYYETPLLTIAILYHKHLGIHSPLYNYIQLLETTTTGNNKDDDDDNIMQLPLLWNKKKLRREATSSVRKLVRGIQSDVQDMYDTIMVPLQEEHPTIFSRTDCSLDAFRWAFAMVNSRHWYLPIPDLSSEGSRKPTSIQTMEESEYGGYNEQVLPASQPTEEWVREQGELDSDSRGNGIEQRRQQQQQQQQQDIRGVAAAKPESHHSFMAPLGDLLNFGPPCVRGSYNSEKRTFELIATCKFLAGQEVTFWYSDDCEDVMIANYGFTHPMVPRCPSAEDWREKSQLWKQRAVELETQIEESFKELGRMDVELEELRETLRKCDCYDEVESGEETPATSPNVGPTKLRRWRQEPTDDPMGETADGLRGEGGDNQEHRGAHARHGIRKKWHRRSSNSGSSL